MIFLQSLVFSNLHNLYIYYIETANLLYKDHTVSVWHYRNSENPYRPSTATCLVKHALKGCPAARGPGGGEFVFGPLLVPGIIPMAPGGLWHAFPRPEGQNGGTATHLVTF